MSKKAPGKSYRTGLTSQQFYRMFPNDTAAEDWFIQQRWTNGVCCPRCGSLNVQEGTTHKKMRFRCRKSKAQGCGKFFSTKTGTFMEQSNLGYQDWLFALYLFTTNLKSVASMKLHRELDISQKSAWFLAHRLRKACGSGDGNLFAGPVEVDESHFGGKARNMSVSKRKMLTGRGPADKTAVVGIRDRATNKVKAKVVPDTTRGTLGGFVTRNVIPGTRIYTDEAKAYTHLPNHKAVKHSVSEYVRDDVHTNGIESFWAMLKRAHKGTFHRLSAKHLHRYVDEFVSRHNFRSLDTLDQMALLAKRMEGKQLRYKDLVG